MLFLLFLKNLASALYVIENKSLVNMMSYLDYDIKYYLLARAYRAFGYWSTLTSLKSIIQRTSYMQSPRSVSVQVASS